MKITALHPWTLTPKQAIQLQTELQKKLVLQNSFKKIKLIAGCDLALDPRKNIGFGGVVVYSWPDLKLVENKFAAKQLTFPYIPGLLSFREIPVLIEALTLLKTEPDLFIFDGQGIAHPRGLGIAAHMGLLLNKPSIGCGKSKLYGLYQEPGPKSGDQAPLHSKTGEFIGSVLRTKVGCNPVFISPGNHIDLQTSVEIILKCLDGYRIPKPTREADYFVEECKRKASV
jgi:deoxyribonuclease V